MGLRAVAEADLAMTVEDSVGGFGWPCTLTDPDGNITNHVGLTNDVHAIADPDTGVGMTSRVTTVALRKSTLPIGKTVEGSATDLAVTPTKPWVVAFENIGGVPHIYRVKRTQNDDALGLLVCELEPYTP